MSTTYVSISNSMYLSSSFPLVSKEIHDILKEKGGIFLVGVWSLVAILLITLISLGII